MKVIRIVALLGVLASSACVHAPASIQTQAGRTAFTADQALQRVGEFQQAVIDGQQAGKIKVHDAQVLVQWTVSIAQTLKATPSGWQATVTTGWASIRPGVLNVPALAPWVSTLDIVFASLGGQ